MPFMAWTVLSDQRHRSGRVSVTWWCAGSVLIGVGFTLISVSRLVSANLALGLGNAVIMAGALASANSLRIDLGIAWSSKFVGVWTILYAVVQFLVRWLGPGGALQLRLSWVLYLPIVGAILHIVALANRVDRNENSRSARWISRVYTIVAAAMLIRAVAIWTGIIDAPSLESGFDMILLTISLVLAAVIAHIGYVGLAVERSERRELAAALNLGREQESHRLTSQIAQLDRQRSLAVMAYSLGHELTQPLGAISLNAELARRRILTSGPEELTLVELIERVLKNVLRATDIVDRIRLLVVPSKETRKNTNLISVVEEAASLLTQEAQLNRVAIKISFSQPEISVMADPLQLSQVFINLLRNAIQAVQTHVTREAHVQLIVQEPLVSVRVRDTGPGLPPDSQGKVGVPFFTTKPGGMGIGLSVCRSIVEQHGGRFSIENAAGGGAVAEIKLPLATTQASTAS